FRRMMEDGGGGLKAMVQAERRLRQSPRAAAGEPARLIDLGAAPARVTCPAWPGYDPGDSRVVLLLARVEHRESPVFDILDIAEDHPARLQVFLRKYGALPPKT